MRIIFLLHEMGKKVTMEHMMEITTSYSPNRKEIVYSEIKEHIITGDWKPNSFVQEKELIEWLGVSRTPVRDAINRLEQEGWLDVYPRKGIKMLDFSIKYIADIFQIRSKFEPILIELAINNLSHFALDAYQIQFTKKMTENKKSLDIIDNEFHRYILQSTNNHYLYQILDNIYDHTQRIRNLSPIVDDRLTEAHQEHLELIAALKARNIQEAQDILTRHVGNSLVSFLKSMEMN